MTKKVGESRKRRERAQEKKKKRTTREEKGLGEWAYAYAGRKIGLVKKKNEGRRSQWINRHRSYPTPFLPTFERQTNGE